MATQGELAGEDPAGVFQKLVPVISPLIGRHFTNVTNGLFGENIITSQEISGIKSQPNLNDGQRGSEVAFLLYNKIKEIDNRGDDPVQFFLKICDVFESDLVNDASLKKHGVNMRSKFTRVSPAPPVQPIARVQPTMTPRASEDCSIPPNDDTPDTTADCTTVLEMENKVARQPELNKAAYVLRQKYIVLEIAVLQSLKDQNIEDTKESIKACVRRGGCKTNRQLIKRINEIENLRDLFDFLRSNNYIGYLNYKILKRLSELIPQDDGLKKRVDDYETEYARFLNKIYCHELVDLFEEYDDLSPTAPVGLPHVTFHLDSPWLHKQFYTWITTFGQFSWSEYTFLMHLRESSVIITYAILPCVLDKAMQDLKDPSVLAKLKTDGITVDELPEQEERGTGTSTILPSQATPSSDINTNIGKFAIKVFKKTVPDIMETLGDEPPFKIVIKKLSAEDLITDPEVKHIKAKPSPAEKGDEITQRLLDRIKDSDDPVQCLLTICDVFESEQVANPTLKKHGENMRSNFTSTDAAAISKDSTMEGKGSDAVVHVGAAKRKEDVDVKNLVKELKSVTQSQYSSITGLPKESLRAVADEMKTRGIIGKGVNNDPTYHAIISEFETGLSSYTTVAEVEEHCKKFLSALEEVGGGAAIKAKQLRKGWIGGVEAKLMTINLK